MYGLLSARKIIQDLYFDALAFPPTHPADMDEFNRGKLEGLKEALNEVDRLIRDAYCSIRDIVENKDS